ncbi:putative ribosomal N-acetyltransferase YdaF [compost metagenome]
MTTLRIDDTLELRALEHAHAESWFAALDANREYLNPWIRTPARAQTLADAHAYMERCVNARLDGTGHFFGIWQAGSLIGEVLLFAIRREDRQGEVGYWLAEAMQGRGIITRACRAIIDFGFADLGLHRLELRCGSENLRSQAVATRLSFTREGKLRQAFWMNERFHDQVLYSLLATERPQAGS